MRTYEVRAVVQLKEPLRSDQPNGETVSGYLQIFGVDAESVEAGCELVRGEIVDGTVIEFRGGEKSPESMGPEAQKLYRRETKPRVWYKSGRAFFSAGRDPSSN